jgi:hypothetical protein
MKWIHVDEQLPSEGGAYIVAYEHKYQEGLDWLCAWFDKEMSEFRDMRDDSVMDNLEYDGLVVMWMAVNVPNQ